MPSTQDISSGSGPCYLLNLPLELQLPIYELVVTEEKPLLLNRPCNSSYRGRYPEMAIDKAAWKEGEKHPPSQPALSRTCRSVREAALPIFYRENFFRASYCYQANMLPAPIKWLKMIGKDNRENLRRFYFYDRNQSHDSWTPHDLETLKGCEVFTEMGGRMETFSNKFCCAHLVTFGEGGRNAGETLSSEELRSKLKLEEED
jgi:hypothetical protein